MPAKLSLIISVYRASRNLELIFAALKRQSWKDFEVIVADDGSGPEIEAVVRKAKGESAFPLNHVWQEDRGFRKNAILNKAIGASESDYLAFIDGDCIPHRHFLLDHWNERRENTLLSGRRVNLGKSISEALTSADIATGSFERLSLRLLWDGIQGRSTNIEDGIRIGSPIMRQILHRNRARILGCNFSVERSLLEKINGFDEDYVAPGIGEDTDLAFRMELAGVKLSSLRYLGILFHLYHDRTHVGRENIERFESRMVQKQCVCRNGLRKYAHSVA